MRIPSVFNLAPSPHALSSLKPILSTSGLCVVLGFGQDGSTISAAVTVKSARMVPRGSFSLSIPMYTPALDDWDNTVTHPAFAPAFSLALFLMAMGSCYTTTVVGIAVWLGENWFSVLQSVGIVGSLVFAGHSAHAEVRARKVGDILTLSAHHRELWSEFHRRPDLVRILQRDIDLIAKPITLAEEEFLNIVFVHVQTAWELARHGGLLSLQTLRVDMKHFLGFPIPLIVWKGSRPHRDAKFVAFMNSNIPRRRKRAHPVTI